MFESSQSIVNKLFLLIMRHSESAKEMSAFFYMQDILYRQFCIMLHDELPWDDFHNGGVFHSNSHSADGISASVVSDDCVLWSIRIKIKDSVFNRRRWIYHIALQQIDHESVRLYYVKCCYDHTAGSINSPRTVPNLRDSLADSIFFNDQLLCFCGAHPLPLEPVLLSSTTLPHFIDLLQDETRTQPLVLITCPWLISPELLADWMLGNAIIFWCQDSSVIMRLNALLPREMYIPWESVRIFTSITGTRTYHPYYEYEEIQRMGSQCFISGLLRAYCQSLRSEEMRTFPSVEDLQMMNCNLRLKNLQSQIDDYVSKTALLTNSINSLEEEKKRAEQLIAELSLYKDSSDLKEYEDLLNETMSEMDSIKKEISNLTARLYASIGKDFQPDEDEKNAIIQELSHAIKTYLVCNCGHP